MANEILVISTRHDDDGAVHFMVALMAPLSPAIHVRGNVANTKVTPANSDLMGSDSIPEPAKSELEAAVPGTLAAIDAGDIFLWIVSVEQVEGESDAATLNRVRGKFTANRDRRIQKVRDRFERTGQVFDV
jgi:hypothetical protein